ncbi:Bro10 [Heliothis virescens ascovirus 3j]|uniref:Bro10 n=1 Tax=Heliothis virescens ascovirus 3j TaxID=1561067 RepID=A0A2Z5UZG6_9VIRU|nr:Bro10 [Heliothis virescens ascovirus 3j]
MSIVKVQFANVDLEVVIVRDDGGQLWLLANPFARILEYSNAPKAISTFVTKSNQIFYENIKSHHKTEVTSSTIQAKSKFITKSGLHELVLKSRMRYAAEFRYWLVNELFPSLKIDALDDFDVWRVDPKNRKTLDEQLPKNDQLDPGCVYVITNDMYEPAHIYKIGYTYNLNERLSELNVASAFDFRPVLVVPTTHCRRLETLLHSKYDVQRVRREFFTLDSDHLRELREFCNDYLLNIVE